MWLIHTGRCTETRPEATWGDGTGWDEMGWDGMGMGPSMWARGRGGMQEVGVNERHLADDHVPGTCVTNTFCDNES